MPDQRLSPVQAVGVSVLNGSLYVGLIYVYAFLFPLKVTQSGHAYLPDPITDRNHPLVIRMRIKSVAVSTLLSVALTTLILCLDQSVGIRAALEMMGIISSVTNVLVSVILGLGLSCVLYFGPLFAEYVEGSIPFANAFTTSPHSPPLSQQLDIFAFRNYVVGPVSEELVFRSCIIPLWIKAGFSTTAVIFLSPSLFSIAHAHHFIFNLKESGSVKHSLLVLAFQSVYTMLFGWFASMVFIKTSSVYGCIASHVFCNVMGLPDLSRLSAGQKNRPLIVACHLLGVVAFGFLIARYRP